MDMSSIYWILFFTLSIFFLSSCAVFLTRGRNGRAQLMKGAAPVVVTSATHTAPGGYPVTQIPATTYQPNAYGTPYPAQTAGNVTVQMPMGMPMPGGQPAMPAMPPQMGTAGAYPPTMPPGGGAVNMNPPSYDMAMANPGPSVVPGTYEKQMPYNPNYAQ
ncbi:U1 small nuclear ribonucleoprotein C isoform X2 [Drosophila navojoa]|uniref:U1 small nuclear ribonucleoprotein C isoform X2 n=1 Tax=Drosophila navojoa TaxID=7232 RepID=UPI0011BE0E2C|nr:U1 small nuclear ribonucleoprotein C isoform X2 [Drosophila navojoa]